MRRIIILSILAVAISALIALHSMLVPITLFGVVKSSIVCVCIAIALLMCKLFLEIITKIYARLVIYALAGQLAQTKNDFSHRYTPWELAKLYIRAKKIQQGLQGSLASDLIFERSIKRLILRKNIIQYFRIATKARQWQKAVKEKSAFFAKDQILPWHHELKAMHWFRRLSETMRVQKLAQARNRFSERLEQLQADYLEEIRAINRASQDEIAHLKEQEILMKKVHLGAASIQGSNGSAPKSKTSSK